MSNILRESVLTEWVYTEEKTVHDLIGSLKSFKANTAIGSNVVSFREILCSSPEAKEQLLVIF